MPGLFQEPELNEPIATNRTTDHPNPPTAREVRQSLAVLYLVLEPGFLACAIPLVVPSPDPEKLPGTVPSPPRCCTSSNQRPDRVEKANTYSSFEAPPRGRINLIAKRAIGRLEKKRRESPRPCPSLSYSNFHARGRRPKRRAKVWVGQEVRWNKTGCRNRIEGNKADPGHKREERPSNFRLPRARPALFRVVDFPFEGVPSTWPWFYGPRTKSSPT